MSDETKNFPAWRSWINRDDGAHFQIGNRNLSGLEIVGHLFLLTALVVYLLYDKVGLEVAWLGWSLALLGLTVASAGVLWETRSSHDANMR